MKTPPKTLPQNLHALLHDPSHRWLSSWVWTGLFGAMSLLTWTFLPFGTGIVLVLSLICVCEVWRTYYADLIDSAHIGQRREVIGRRALLVHLRLAFAGTVALICILGAFTLATGAGLWSRPVALVCGTAVVAMPFWFISDWVKRCLLSALQQVMNLPFQIAFMVLGATQPAHVVARRHAELNGLACRLFTAVTGYDSTLTFLMETEDLLFRLPRARHGTAEHAA